MLLARNVICPANEDLFLLWLEAPSGEEAPDGEVRGPGYWVAGVGGLAGAEAGTPKFPLWETFKAAAEPHALPKGLELRDLSLGERLHLPAGFLTVEFFLQTKSCRDHKFIKHRGGTVSWLLSP